METEEQVVIEETPIILEKEPRRRRRGRKAAEETIAVEEPKPKPKRQSRRAAKLTGEDVAKGLSLLSQVAVFSTGHPHWYIPPQEIEPWAGEAANLLNRIPAKWIKPFADSASIFTVTLGLYSCLAPRIAQERALQAEAKKPVEQNGHKRDEFMA